MKGCLALMLIVFAAAPLWAEETIKASAGQTGCSAADDQGLRQVAQDWKQAYNDGDSARIAALYTDDAYYLTQHFVTGVLHGRAAIRAYFQNGIDAKYRVDTIEVLSVSCSGDSAYTITRYEATNGGQKAVGVNLVVLRKMDGKWMIVAHEAAVPDPASAIQKLDVKTD